MNSEQIYKNNHSSEEFIKIKHRGKVYTPDYLVLAILDQGHYTIGNIRQKHVIDNSCGDGQFLIHIIDRYCKDFLLQENDRSKLKNELETYIHAIEIDCNELDTCIQRCNEVASVYGVTQIDWDFINEDALKTNSFDGKMDFVLGNPPYVRVHNLNEDLESVKSFLFGNGGMTDLFIVFYELGLKMLNDTGVLCYITPSSFFTSMAGSNMRRYLVDNEILESVCNLKHFQAFESTTYTTIVCLNKQKICKETSYYEFDERFLGPAFVDNIPIQKYFINNNFYFSNAKNLELLTNILQNYKQSDICVKNGYATLADKIFVCDFPFQSKYVIPVLKASRGKWTKIFYPYDADSKLISEEILKQDKELYSYLISKKDALLTRSLENNSENYWYAFGRSQAINDTHKDKLAINALIRESSDLKITDVPSGCGVYGGLYITSDTIDFDEIKTVLRDREFVIYVSLLGKYKSGGYYTFSSKDLKIYLDYKLGFGGLFNVN